MPSQAIDSLISTLAGLFSGVSPFAKAIVPSAAGLVTALVNMLIAGSFNTTSLVVLGCGLVTSAAVYIVPNLERKPKPTPAPVPAPAPAPKKG